MKSLRTLSHSRFFSSLKLKQAAQGSKFHKALRVLDIISPKSNVTSNLNSHLRIIQDFPLTDSSRLKHCCKDLSLLNTRERISSVSGEIFESSFVKNEILYSINGGDLPSSSLGFTPSDISIALSSCGSTWNLHRGIQYHCLAKKTGLAVNIYVGSSLVSFYGKCGELEDAYKAFKEMPVKNVVSWTAIIAGFAQEWHVDECLGLFSMMRSSMTRPNDFTFTSIFSACMATGALGQGRSVHCQTIHMGFVSYCHVNNALISMYCKCGCLDDAYYIFNTMSMRDVVSWNSMIAGYAQYGLAVQAINLFEEMKRKRVKPDGITFLGVLSSCRHAGLVKEGQVYFDSMDEYGVRAGLDHYSCVVDLLGRAGLLEEARSFTEKMPMNPNAVIWGSLLFSCRLHGDVWTGIQAAKSRLLLKPGCVSTHIQLANMYASLGFWDLAARVRRVMKDRVGKSNPGCSWIEIKNEVHRFKAEDESHGRVVDILAILDCLADHMKTLGYVTEMREEAVIDMLCIMVES